MKKVLLVAAVLFVAVAISGWTPASACGHYPGVSMASSLQSMFGDLGGFNFAGVYQDGGHAMTFRVRRPDGSSQEFGANGGGWNSAIAFMREYVQRQVDQDGPADGGAGTTEDYGG